MRDVFISYSSHDKLIADALCATLESRQIRCWIAPRDVLPGVEYPKALNQAISNSRVMVLVLSSSSNNSPQVLREVERAVSKAIPIIPFKIEDMVLSESMEFLVSTQHWLDALTPPMERHMQKLAEIILHLLPDREKDARLQNSEPISKGAAGGSQWEQEDKVTFLKSIFTGLRNKEHFKTLIWGVSLSILLLVFAVNGRYLDVFAGKSTGDELPMTELKEETTSVQTTPGEDEKNKSAENTGDGMQKAAQTSTTIQPGQGQPLSESLSAAPGRIEISIPVSVDPLGPSEVLVGAYEGDIVAGKANGTGKWETSKGITYSGGFKDNKFNGTGQLFSPDGHQYTGDWLDGNRHGTGTQTWPAGSMYGGKYVGDWKYDSKNGSGTRTFSNGARYVGEFKNNNKDGQGTYTTADGHVYKGKWKNDTFVGP